MSPWKNLHKKIPSWGLVGRKRVEKVGRQKVSEANNFFSRLKNFCTKTLQRFITRRKIMTKFIWSFGVKNSKEINQ